MNKQEETQLVTNYIKNCDKKALDKLLNQHMNFFYRLGHKYSYLQPVEDTINDCVVCFIEKIKYFNPNKGRLSTVMYKIISQDVKAHAMASKYHVSVPESYFRQKASYVHALDQKLRGKIETDKKLNKYVDAAPNKSSASVLRYASECIVWECPEEAKGAQIQSKNDPTETVYLLEIMDGMTDSELSGWIKFESEHSHKMGSLDHLKKHFSDRRDK